MYLYRIVMVHAPPLHYNFNAEEEEELASFLV